jgi:hypothetical protein
VDGVFTELNIKSFNVAREAQVILRSAWVNRKTGENVENVDLELSGLNCLLVGKKVLSSITCSRDDRPVDGALVQIIVKRNKHNTFDAVMKTTIVSRMTGKQTTKTESLANDLRKK